MEFTKIKTTKPVQAEVSKPKEYDWHFGSRSRQRLEGINPKLIQLTHRALQLSSVDFGVTCGMRTQHEQNQLRASGASQINRSRHQDGMAIDIFVYVDGKGTWELDHYITAAEGFALAAKEMEVDLRWGGGWTHYLNKYTAKQSRDGYAKHKKKQGRRQFIDGPHFEFPKE